MKKETKAAKLAALLGLTEHLEVAKAKQSNRNRVIEVTEDEIQNFRAAQGLSYFLQAPQLFSLKVCKHCGADFLVSRQLVSLCSYTCIKNDLAECGIVWSRWEQFEAMAQDPQVYDGNEPIWIRNIDKLQEALEYLTSSRSTLV